jgi:uncharacterized damage-inducible protein DinB
MTTNFLEKFFEHNHWANLQIIQVYLALSDEQLDLNQLPPPVVTMSISHRR